MITKSIFSKNTKLLPSLKIINITTRSFHVTIRNSFNHLITQKSGTYLCLLQGITIAKRFGSKPPKGPIPPTSAKIGKGTLVKPSSLAKPLPPEPKPMSPKHYNHNNVGGPKPLPPYDPSRDSYLAKPNVVWAIKQKQTETIDNTIHASKKPSMHGTGNPSSLANETTTTSTSTVNTNPLNTQSNSTIPDNESTNTTITTMTSNASPNTSTTSSSDAHTNSVSLSNNAEESLNNKTTSMEQSMPTNSNLTSSSFNEDSESVKETEDLAQKALDMKLIVRRDAPNNPHAGIEHMTVTGNSLYTELQMKEHPQISQNPIDLSNTTFQTGTLDIDENQTLIPRSDQNHPVITNDNGKIIAWGYLTSHDGNGNIKIADKQMDGAKTSDGKDKPQFYKPFEQPVEVSPENFTRHYDGDAYLQDAEISKKLSIINSDVSQYEPIPYQKIGVTREELEAMVAKQIIEEGEKTFTEEKKPSNFKTDDDKKKKKKSEEDAAKNKANQLKESQAKKDKAKFDAENKPKATTHDE